MPNLRIGLARQTAYYLADDPQPWPTLGDLMIALGCRKGTAMGERVREARGYYGFVIKCVEVKRNDKLADVYFMPYRERERVKRSDGYKAWKATQRSGRKAA